MDRQFQELKTLLREASDLAHVNSLLFWDQSTYMPAGGAPARSRQNALLGRLAHERATDPAIGRLLDQLQPWAEGLPYDSDEASLVRVARRAYERAVKVPPAFVAEVSSHTTASYQAWTEARPANDFTRVRPYLEKTLDLSRRYAEYFAPYEHIADPLIDESDYGMKTATIRSLFAELRTRLMPIAAAITAQPLADDACLRQYFPEAGQWAFGVEVARQIGFDFERGRLDKTHHPFMIKFSGGDVRITTRVDEHEFGYALFSTIHEAGHAMYEQGIKRQFDDTTLARGTSSGVHESQSRLWENLVGRGWSFWQYHYPRLQATFPHQLGNVPLEMFHRAVNKVQRSLIRTEADEVTYNLHVMLRFDLELQMLEGKLAVADLPEAWRTLHASDLGVTPPDDKDGVMQDMHWYSGFIGGAFQGYTLGNIMSAQFYDAALKAHPEIPDEIAQGQFGALLGWLREHIHQHGSKFTAAELVARVTGGPLSIEPYIRYLRTKYGGLYKL